MWEISGLNHQQHQSDIMEANGCSSNSDNCQVSLLALLLEAKVSSTTGTNDCLCFSENLPPPLMTCLSAWPLQMWPHLDEKQAVHIGHTLKRRIIIFLQHFHSFILPFLQPSCWHFTLDAHLHVLEVVSLPTSVTSIPMGSGHVGLRGSIWFAKYVVTQSMNGWCIEFNLSHFKLVSAICILHMIILQRWWILNIFYSPRGHRAHLYIKNKQKTIKKCYFYLQQRMQNDPFLLQAMWVS